MSIFQFKEDNVELAYQLFSTLTVGNPPDYKYLKSIRKIEAESTVAGAKYPDRQKILCKIIELAGEPNTPKQRFIIAKAYAWSRAEFRNKAIKYLELYLNNQLYEDAYKGIKHNSNSTLEFEKKHHICEMKKYLAEAYSGIYDFDKALQIWEDIINIMPQSPIGYFGKAEILTKQNKLQDCKAWLTEIKLSSPYYKIIKSKNEFGQTITDAWFFNSINKLLQDTNDKIKKGYVYKPRNKNHLTKTTV